MSSLALVCQKIRSLVCLLLGLCYPRWVYLDVMCLFLPLSRIHSCGGKETTMPPELFVLSSLFIV